jgi:hypothetical protein
MAASFGSFGPAGPGFGSIQNISGPSTNPTAFPPAPSSGGLAPGGLGNMVGVNLQSPGMAPQSPGGPQPFRAPLPLPPPPAGTPSTPATAAGNPFTNVQIPQGQNTAVAEPFGGLNRQQWQGLTPQQQGAVMGPMGEYQSGLGAMPSGNNFVASSSNPSGSNPQASMALALMNAGGSGFNQMVGRGGQPANSLFGLGGV